METAERIMSLKKEIEFLEGQITTKRIELVSLNKKKEQEEKERKTIEATNAIREVLSINKDRILFLIKDISDGYSSYSETSREILLDCLKLALIMKEAESIEIKF